jgi:hypothetical protein
MPEKVKFVEYEGTLESKEYEVGYKMGVDNNAHPDLTVVMLAFQVEFDTEKSKENDMLAKVFRRFADELEGKVKLPKAQQEEFKPWEEKEQQELDFENKG